MPTVSIQQAQPVQISVSPGIGASVVVNGTATSIVGTAGINPFVAGDNITITTTGGGITIFGRDPPVVSVQGLTGTVSLSAADVGAADASHTHEVADISGFVAAAAAASPVQSVSGRTGDVSLSTTDISGFSTAAALASPVQSVAGRTGVVSILSADIADLATAVVAAAPVASVAGRTGHVALGQADIEGLTAWQATHTHSYVSSVQGRTGTVNLTFADISAASFTHTHQHVSSLNLLVGDVNLVEGSGINISINGNSVEIAAESNTAVVSAVLWPAFILGG